MTHVLEIDQLIEKAMEIAKKIISKGPLAIAGVIRSINQYFQPGAEGFPFEARTFGDVAATEDFREGTSAFIEKRKPAFQGR